MLESKAPREWLAAKGLLWNAVQQKNYKSHCSLQGMAFDELFFVLSVNVERCCLLCVPWGPKKLSVSLLLQECVNDRSLFQSNVPLHLTASHAEVLVSPIPLSQTTVKDKRMTNSKNDCEETLGINLLSGIKGCLYKQGVCVCQTWQYTLQWWFVQLLIEWLGSLVIREGLQVILFYL